MKASPERSEALEIQDTGDDVLVHDTRVRKIHVLNRTAGVVLQACDGRTDAAAIAKRLEGDGAAPCALEDVTAVLQQFELLGLIQA
ncbi:MAG: PqqD family protein [Candidatus Baltobacteraceae bacterium]